MLFSQIKKPEMKLKRDSLDLIAYLTKGIRTALKRTKYAHLTFPLENFEVRMHTVRLCVVRVHQAEYLLLFQLYWQV